MGLGHDTLAENSYLNQFEEQHHLDRKPDYLYRISTFYLSDGLHGQHGSGTVGG